MNTKFILNESANPNYLATICKIEDVYPIEGADKLVKTVINGYDIVISKDHKPGDIVVYFPVESSICEKYLSANNLYELSEANRNSNFIEVEQLVKSAEEAEDDLDAKQFTELAKSKCGFFNKHGRVRMIKLRGQYSQGFIADISSMVKYMPELDGTDWEKLVGTQFSHVGDEEFVKKYIPAIKVNEHHGNSHDRMWKKRTKKLKRFNRIREDQFAFHYSTKMLAEHFREFSPEDEVTISVKVHGCVEKNTIVNTLEYGDRTIGEIVDNKINCSIKSFNTVTKEIEYAPIEQFYYVPNDGDWYEIELEDGTKLTITGNNPVWCPELNCYRRVDELNGDEKLLVF